MFEISRVLIELAAVDFFMQYAVFAISACFNTVKFYDLTGSATFVTLTYLCSKLTPEPSLRQTIQAAMVIAWAARLGTFLFLRVLIKGDRRLDKARDKPLLFFVYWTLQGLWVFITLLPTIMLLSRPDILPLTNRDYLGFGLFSVGFITEMIADYQKSKFSSRPENKGKYMNTGLWSVSRHPNYLGEILLWFGLYFSASSTFRGKEMLTVLCPVFDMFLITKLSGIPPLEKHGIQRWGKDPNYVHYIKHTSVLIPYIW